MGNSKLWDAILQPAPHSSGHIAQSPVINRGYEQSTWENRPYYINSYSTPATVGTSERSPLIDGTAGLEKEEKMIHCAWMWVRLLMAATSVAVVVALIIQTSRVSVLNQRLKAYPPTPAELDEIRRAWEIEKAAHEQDYETWDYARVAHEADVKHWLRARNDHHQLRAYEADRLGLSWDRIEGHECVAYGTREYSARLAINQLEACHNMAFVVDGIAADEPHECHAEGDTFKSVWNVNNDTACKPYWGDLYDKGCVGRGSGKHRFEARLWDINGKSDWMAMCSTTPQKIGGKHYGRPTHCEHRGPLYGMIGMWDVDDFFCRFG